MDEYLPMFLAEGREHLQELNLAVVRIEETPDDQATVDEIFRIAHSLKGMSATMGFSGMAALTHEMEDVFELLRQRTTGLERVAVDVLFECLDALSAAVESIDTTGAEEIQPQRLIEMLRGLVRERTPEQEAERTGISLAEETELSELADGRRVIQIHATPRRRGLDARRARLHGALGDRRLRRDAALQPLARQRRHLRRPRHRRVGRLRTHRHRDPGRRRLGARGGLGRGLRGRRPTPRSTRRTRSRSRSRRPRRSHSTSTCPPARRPLPRPSPLRRRWPGAAKEKPAADKKQHGGSSTVRVDAERLDQLMHFMGELVLHRTQVEALIAQSDVPGLSQAMQNLTRTSHALQSMVMQVRMIPVEAVFLRFPRLVRDLSTKLGKQVDLQLVGKDTELDRTVVDALGDPLVHLVRNSLDHGLEGVEERRAAGKPDTGILEISAQHAGGNVIITVADDGRGIDARRVAEKAAERGLIAAGSG